MTHYSTDFKTGTLYGLRFLSVLLVN